MQSRWPDRRGRATRRGRCAHQGPRPEVAGSRCHGANRVVSGCGAPPTIAAGTLNPGAARRHGIRGGEPALIVAFQRCVESHLARRATRAAAACTCAGSAAQGTLRFARRRALALLILCSDLFYRLNTFPITIPPLCERTADIPAMVARFFAKHSELYGKKLRGLTDKAMRKVLSHARPGNIRELDRKRAPVEPADPAGDAARHRQPLASGAAARQHAAATGVSSEKEGLPAA